jgi:hypothetical protein
MAECDANNIATVLTRMVQLPVFQGVMFQQQSLFNGKEG